MSKGERGGGGEREKEEEGEKEQAGCGEALLPSPQAAAPQFSSVKEQPHMRIQSSKKTSRIEKNPKKPKKKRTNTPRHYNP
jgi:hypothetical protein